MYTERVTMKLSSKESKNRSKEMEEVNSKIAVGFFLLCGDICGSLWVALDC